jgi:hypothetical protein
VLSTFLFEVSFRRRHVRAAMTAFLISDQTALTAGQDLTVEGGMTRKMIYVK